MITNRMKMVTTHLQNMLQKKHKSPETNNSKPELNTVVEHKYGEKKTNNIEMVKRGSDLTGNFEEGEMNCEKMTDSRVEVYDHNVAEDENMFESTSLTCAIKKLQEKSDYKKEIKTCTQYLADLFFLADADGTGHIDEKEYQQMLDKLNISEDLRNSLGEKFNTINSDGIDEISMTEFLLFFLTFPKFRKEFEANVNTNLPYVYEKTLTGYQYWRKYFYCVVEHPEYNNVSKILFCTDLYLTLVPIIILIIEGSQSSRNIIWFMNPYMWFISIFFALEYFCGLLMCNCKRKFIFDVMHMFELVSFLFWIFCNTVVQVRDTWTMGFVVFRIVRVVDLPKVFQLKTIKEDVDMYINVLKLTYASSGAVLLLLAVMIVLFSLLIYVFERGLYSEIDGRWERDGDEGESPFARLSSCVYFVLVTMTTLGYGDMYPITHLGRLVGTVMVLVGLCNITFLINIVDDCFAEVFHEYVIVKSEQMHEEEGRYLTDCVKKLTEGQVFGA